MQIGWIDLSSEDREKVSRILSALGEKGTMDELGIGQIRDAFSDLLFPGFSTIQTRAKYLVIVPRIFEDFRKLPSHKKPLLEYLEHKETEVAEKLVSVHGSSERGIIGSEKVGKGGVKRKPSSIYWRALMKFEIVHPPMSFFEFCKRYEKRCRLSGQRNVEASEESVPDEIYVDTPDHDPHWFENLNIHLTREEAWFIKDKLETSSIRESVPTQILKHHLLDEAIEMDDLEDLTSWITGKEDVSEVCKNDLMVANHFSKAMEGTFLYLNFLLARRFENIGSVENTKNEFDTWLESVKEENLFTPGCAERWLQTARKGHDGKGFKTLSETFVKVWAETIRNGAGQAALDDLITNQSIRNKGERSLFKKGPSKSPKLVKETKMNYRWKQVHGILSDLKTGLSDGKS